MSFTSIGPSDDIVGHGNVGEESNISFSQRLVETSSSGLVTTGVEGAMDLEKFLCSSKTKLFDCLWAMSQRNVESVREESDEADEEGDSNKEGDAKHDLVFVQFQDEVVRLSLGDESKERGERWRRKQ